MWLKAAHCAHQYVYLRRQHISDCNICMMQEKVYVWLTIQFYLYEVKKVNSYVIRLLKTTLLKDYADSFLSSCFLQEKDLYLVYLQPLWFVY